MIRPWVFEFCQVPGVDRDTEPDGVALAAGVRWLHDLWVGFEGIGFEGLFLSEHHFMPRGITPSPNLHLAALAPRTSRLRLGVMGLVAPLYAPWRLVEEAGMLDLLTGGRLDIGLSSGSGPMEAARVGIVADEIRPRFDEALDILGLALAGGPVSYEGRFWSARDLTLTPRPVQTPPPVWVTGLSPGAAAATARRGFRFCTAFLSTARVAELFDSYRETARQAGGAPGPEQLGLRRMVFLSDDASEAQEAAARSLAELRASMAPGRQSDAVPDAPKPQEQMISDDDALGGRPTEVAERIVAQCRATGAGHFLAFTPAGLTRAQVERNYELWREVVPILRQAEISV